MIEKPRARIVEVAESIDVSMLGEDEGERVESAYGGQYARLAALERKYDPENLFRLNANLVRGA